MKADFVAEMTPLGPRLAAAARAMGAARQQVPAWLAPLAEVLARVEHAELSLPGRFVRREATGLERIEESAAENRLAGEGEALSDGVRERLRNEVGPAADRVRVHDDEGAHALARRHGADALAIGPDVYFGRGQYRPHDSRGFALLAHETVHVEHATRPDANWQRTGAAALAAEEAMARAVESAQRGGAPGGAPRTFARPPAAEPAQAPAGPAAPTPAAQPMAAAADRALTAAPASAFDLDAMRRTLMRDLMSEIRADMERGG
jgi:hypothetical protein